MDIERLCIASKEISKEKTYKQTRLYSQHINNRFMYVIYKYKYKDIDISIYIYTRVQTICFPYKENKSFVLVYICILNLKLRRLRAAVCIGLGNMEEVMLSPRLLG